MPLWQRPKVATLILLANNSMIEHKVGSANLGEVLINGEMALAAKVFASAISKVISDAES
ncbi:hypothetical protein BEH76_17060 [Shewanella algae]|nr:hypothetical protein BEH76_17060 [Shewanella algae]